MHKDTDLGPAESTHLAFWATVDNIFQLGGAPRGALLPSAEHVTRNGTESIKMHEKGELCVCQHWQAVAPVRARACSQRPSGN